MKTSSLNTPVTISRRTEEKDAWGQPIPGAWAVVAMVWASVRHLGGVESIKADAVTSKIRASIRIRWCTGIDAGMRVLIGAAVYDIIAVLPDMQRREHVDLVCEAKT